MKTKLLTLAILIFFANITFAQKGSSLLTRMLVLQTNQHIYDNDGKKKQYFVLPQKIVEKYAIKKIGKQYIIGALIEVDISTLSEQNLLSFGIKTNTKIGNIWSVEIPIENLTELESLQGIVYIEAGGKVKQQCLDSARIDTRVNLVNNGFQLPLPYNGQGVIVGVVDAGFDFTHPMFKDTSGNNLRISRVWIQGDATGTAPTPFLYGNELIGSPQLVSKGTDNVNSSHGTHVTGIATGSGFGSNGLYRGVASEAEIVQVAYDLNYATRNNVTDAFAYICNYADNVNKPAIVNMSLAYNGGSNDGTTLFERSIDSLISNKHILVVAAGNNFDNYKIHVEKNANPATDTLRTLYSIVNGQPVEIWGEVNASLNLTVSIYDYNGTQLVQTPFYSSVSNPAVSVNYPISAYGTNDTVTISIVGQHLSTLNNKSSFYMEVGSKLGNNYACAISVTSSSGNIHAWNLEESNFYNSINGTVISGAKNGDENYTIFAPGTVQRAITVGAYTTKNTCTYLSGATESIPYFSAIGNIAPFSKRGPCLGGYMKPDITAPGNVITSSVNSFDTYYSNSNLSVLVYNNSWYYAPMYGTSMSAPMVTGIIALMYQANPSLTRNQVENIIKQSARQDSYTGSISSSGDTQWGWGKIDAYNAVVSALTVGVNENSNQSKNVLLYPNPFLSETILKINYNLKNATLTVYNSFGQQVKQIKNISGQTITLHRDNLSSGLYFVRLTQDTKVISVDKLVITD